MDAVKMGSGVNGAGGSKELNEETSKVEEELRKRLPIGWSTSLQTLRRELVENKGYSEQALQRAITVLQRRETVTIRGQGSQIYRSGA
jgi:DNA replication licensing factor MCM5